MKGNLCYYFLQYNELMKKRKIVLSDKAKIEQVIRELDEKKNEALKKAHVQVNKVRSEFQLILDTLNTSVNGDSSL